jgi:hypothetical protein
LRWRFWRWARRRCSRAWSASARARPPPRRSARDARCEGRRGCCSRSSARRASSRATVCACSAAHARSRPIRASRAGASLARAPRRARRGQLATGAAARAPLTAEAPRGEAELRQLRARVHDEASLRARFLRADDRATWVSAPLTAGLAARSAQRFADALRERFDQPPLVRVDAQLELPAGTGRRIATWLGPALGVACVAAALALAGARLAALATLAGVAALLWFRGALAAHAPPRAAARARARAASRWRPARGVAALHRAQRAAPRPSGTRSPPASRSPPWR